MTERGEISYSPKTRRSLRNSLVAAASTLGTEQKSEVEAIINGQGLGSPKCFGRNLRIVRMDCQGKLIDWSSKLGMTDPSILARYERGEHGVPPRNELICLG